MTQPSTEFLDLQAALAGEYSLQRELGRGGMGVVYLARDVQLDRDVAIKVLPAHLARTPSARERFLREARMAAGLSHPHIVPIHRVSEVPAGHPERSDGPRFVFFVMSYVEGETLGERLRTRGPLPPAEAMRVLREVAWALAYAHGRGIVHRDVKPDNILLESATGRALVTDFGIAQGGADAIAVSDPGRVMGTAHFMSPEQAAGEPLDGRSDIYALGVLGYLAVSGRLPFESSNLPALILRQASEDPPSVMRVAPGLPAALGAAIDRCLARDPEGRFPDGEALAEALVPADARPALPPTLRAWLGARNPLVAPYMAWSGVFGTLTTVNLAVWLAGKRPDGPGDIVRLAAIASLPLLPIVGFHLNQAYRQFRAGHTLADLQAALEIGRRERAETEALVRDQVEPRAHRLLRLATVGAATWLAVTFGLLLQGTIHENRTGLVWLFGPVLTTMALGAVSNALGVEFIPTGIRAWWQTGIRDRLWNSRVGAWLARRLGAPAQSRAVGGGVFRATESALGVAAAELFEALPSAYREQLNELPALVALLEARAAEARAEMEVLAAMAPSGSDAQVLAARRKVAKEHLADSVAALESIRLDLLRLHAGASDLAPLTTLMDDARRIGEDLNRLAEAQREVEDAAGQSSRSGRIPTPT
jgi:eukaryotic-like serine/threonine-protein kinase